MIFRALTLLRQELQVGILSHGGAADEVVLGNVAQAGEAGSTILNDKLIISLLGTEEETTLRNTPPIKATSGGFAKINPPLHINIHLLVSAYYVGGTGTAPYENALRRLSQAITFFQGKSVFDLANSPHATLVNDPELAELKLSMELQTLGLEQTNQLWGSLGGRMVPAALYKVRMIAIQADRPSGTGPAIEAIHLNESID
ncbi:MAG: DUF4255 domain-containing protein [Bacteroidia bacterium]